MIKHSLFIALLFILRQAINAQTEFKPGYMISLQMDTIYGEIYNNNYYFNSQQCEFRKNPGEKPTLYKPGELFGYRFSDGKYYIAKSNELFNPPIFLEYLIDGKLDIFFYQSSDRKNHYYAETDSIPMRELIFSEETTNVDGKNYLLTNKRYINLLKFYTSDCPELREALDKLNKPEHKNMINIATQYNEMVCTNGQCVVFEKKIPRKKIIEFNGGMAYLTPYFLSEGDQKYYPNYGFTLLFQQAQQRENLYLGIGLRFNNTELDDFPKQQIPLAICYINTKQGFSPSFGYEFNLNAFVLHAFKGGIRYQKKNLALSLEAQMNTALFIKPYGFQGGFVLSYLIN
jgi:hypothetical protein